MSVPYTSDAVGPENHPTPLAALVEAVTPTPAHYRRNHFPYPDMDVSGWRLPITGAVDRPIEVTLADLRALPRRSSTVLLECAGHRRTEFHPPVSGVQWGLGALSQAEWTGVSLCDVLVGAGVSPEALEIVFHGADRGTFGTLPGEHTFSRSTPIIKALHPDTLLAFEMNGEPLPREHGAPVRALVPGWYAMDSVKWLTAIEVVTEPFQGPFQELDYRFQAVDDPGIGTRIDEMPIHSLFVSIVDGETLPSGPLEVSGIAWSGVGVAAVDVRVDARDWQPAKIVTSGAYQRVRWSTTVDLEPGRTRIEVRATDPRGRVQPEVPIWNRRGYVNNSVQRFSVTVAG